MSVTPAQFEAIAVYRRTFFGTHEGKRVLGHRLEASGAFQDPYEVLRLADERPYALRDFVRGMTILVDLGVWIPENFPRLIDAMATLPPPDVKENRSGKTT